MELRNITENILVDFIDNLEDIKTGKINKNQKLELIAFALNRLKPLYVTSNKGFMNVLIKYQNDPQYFADIMVQTNAALKLIDSNLAEADIDGDDFHLLRNITEYIVVEIVDNIEGISEVNKFELFSYVLNRLKPLYITSDKKFPEIINRWKNDQEFIKDINNKINEGLIAINKIILSAEKGERLDLNIPYFGFPKIYGKIISSVSFVYLESAKLTLFIDSQIAESLFSDMENPLVLIPEDRGIYLFAPKPIHTEKEFELRSLS